MTKIDIWTPSTGDVTPKGSLEVDPALAPDHPDVLYWYDGPLLFVGTYDGRKVLAQYYADDPHTLKAYCTLTEIRDDVLAGAIAGTVPVRDAVLSGPTWVVELGESWIVERAWKDVTLPDEVLPTPGVGIRP